MDQFAPRREIRPWWIALPLAAMALALVLDASDVDRVLESRFFDPVTGGFPLRYDPFLEVVLHYWTKYLVALVAGLAFAGFLLSFQIAALKPQRRALLFIALAIVLSTTAVSAAKMVSVKHCPWDLIEFGGEIAYTKLLEQPPRGTRAGHCFPAGHTSTGFSLLAFYFVGRARRNPRLARAGLALGLTAGLALGFGRMLQGAHFLSHVLWSGILCWLAILFVYVATARRLADVETPASGAEKTPVPQ
jgi:membrane-associated PAP2 superfamily phosphatase